MTFQTHSKVCLEYKYDIKIFTEEKFVKKIHLRIIKRGRSFYYLLLSFMAVLFLCGIIMSAQFMYSTFKNFGNTKNIYHELAQQAMNSVSVLVSDIDTYEKNLKKYSGDSLQHLASLNKEEFLASDLSDFHRSYTISCNLSNQIPGNAVYLYFKNSEYIMGTTSTEDVRNIGEFDLLGISEEDWQHLINISDTPVAFIQQTDQMDFSRLFISKEIASGVVLILALPEKQIALQMERHYLPENSHVLLITHNNQFVMSGTEGSEHIALSWKDLNEDTENSISFDNTSYYLYTQKISESDIKLAVLIPNILKAQTTHSLLITLPVFFLIWLICGGTVSWFFAVHLYKPVLFLLRNLPFQDYSEDKKSDLARIQDLVDSLQSEAKSYEEKLSEQKELLANSLFARLLNHSLDWNESIAQMLSEAGFPSGAHEYMIFLISIVPVAHSQGNDEPLSVLEPLDFQNNIRQLITSEGYHGYVILSGGYFIGIVNLRSETDYPDFEKIQSLIPQESAVFFSVAVSAVHKTMNELPLAYSEALQASDHLLLDDSGQNVSFYSALEYPVSKGQNQFLASIQLLSNYILSGNFDTAVKETDNILLLLGKFSSDRQLLQRNINYLVETVMLATGSISSIDAQKFSLIQKQFPLDTHASVSRLCKQLQLFLSHLPGCMLADDSEKEILNQIIQYVNENYTDPSLSASAVSDRFHVSISWLSIHFKSKTGIGFLDYVHGCRLAKAKDLLYSTNINIKDIALMTGYTNSATFSRAFSRYEGVTPSWYRSSRQNTLKK